MKMTDYRKLCIELFGTDDVDKLKAIAYKKHSGKKNKLSDIDIEEAFVMQQQGKTVETIANHFGVSRQTMSKYLNKDYPGYTLRLDFMHKRKICTKIYVDFENEKIRITNSVSNPIYTAFGVIENPTWEDFQDFLAERCFPEDRFMAKTILKQLDISSGYDPLEIIRKTQGRMAEDNQYIKITTIK